MSAASTRIAKALNTTNNIAFRSEPSAAGMTRGWFMLKPAGGWKYLGANEAEVLNDAREQREYREDWQEQQAANGR